MESHVESYRADLLSMSAGRDHDGPVLMMTVRPDVRFWWPCTMTFTKEQAIRMRLLLDDLLDDPESWLHVPKSEQRQEPSE